MRDFCRTHHLAWSVLQRHLKRRRLGKVESKEIKRSVPVALLGAKGNRDAPRRRIEVRPDFDSGTLERLLNIIAWMPLRIRFIRTWCICTRSAITEGRFVASSIRNAALSRLI